MILRGFALSVLALLVSACMCSPLGGDAGPEPARDPALRDGVVLSKDGVALHYVSGGRGDTALVFVHGWLGNAEWWRPLMERFAADYEVVALDLAGHGRSGSPSEDWSVERFADDVIAVVNDLGLERVVLIGHSMSGAITVEAATQLRGRCSLLVPVDTLNDFEWDLPPETWAQFFAGLRADFPTAVEAFFRGLLFAPSSPPEVVERVVREARAANPQRAVPMLERAHDYDLKGALRCLRSWNAPFHAIQSDRNPTNLETNRKYVERFEVELMPASGHWPMLEDPQAFGDALARVLASEGLAPAAR